MTFPTPKLTLCAAILSLIASSSHAELTLAVAESIQASPEESPSDRQSEFKSAAALGVDISKPAGKLPENKALAAFEANHPPAFVVLNRGWPVTTCYWRPACTRHNPLYFEEVNAERYGYAGCECLQPAVSAAHFFGTIPALPYLMGADCPRECVYTLGHYRPGNCNPRRAHWPPCRLDAAAVESGAIAGLILLIP